MFSESNLSYFCIEISVITRLSSEIRSKSNFTFEVKYIILSFEIIFESIIQIFIIKISQNDEEN